MDEWVDSAQSCRIHSTGRVSGQPHQVTVWFAYADGTIYVLSRHGEQADWVQNVRADAHVSVSHGRSRLRASARVVTDSAEAARGARAMFDKYSPRHRRLEAWLEGGVTVIAIDVGPDGG